MGGRGSLADINLREAVNAISDVIQNRPRPLREFDQIYMRAGDMVLQSQYVADWAAGKRLAFLGDGDAISVATAYLRRRNIIDYWPTAIDVFDFDERIVRAIKRFADSERIENLDAHLYNCLDPVEVVDRYDCFYTNPPWGASNAGSSVNVFVQRGFELLDYEGEGLVVIADREPDLAWTEEVLANVQRFSSEHGFYVSRMMPRLHSYHLDDNPELRSCNLQLRSLPGNGRALSSAPIDAARLADFYGVGRQPLVRYIRERLRVDYGKAQENEYVVEHWEDER
jgi:predicted methyltransferase